MRISLTEQKVNMLVCDSNRRRVQTCCHWDALPQSEAGLGCWVGAWLLYLTLPGEGSAVSSDFTASMWGGIVLKCFPGSCCGIVTLKQLLAVLASVLYSLCKGRKKVLQNHPWVLFFLFFLLFFSFSFIFFFFSILFDVAPCSLWYHSWGFQLWWCEGNNDLALTCRNSCRIHWSLEACEL